MYKKLLALHKQAYAPYSNFFVSSISVAGGKEYKGVNIENAAYPVGICAERVAASNAIMDGNKKIDSVHLLTHTISFGMPCGMCRQFLSEFMEDTSLFYIYNKEGKCEIFEMKDILPNRFTKKDLTKKEGGK